MLTDQDRIAFRTCPLCESMCGLEITVEGGRAVKVAGDKDDVFSRGHICPKGASLAELHNDPERLRRPLVRDGGGFKEVTWDEAFERVELGIMPLIEKYGPDAVGVYLGNPCSHTLAAALCMRPMLKALKTRNVFSSSTVDQMPKHVSCGLMFGSPSFIPVPDVDRTDYLLVIGANPAVSNGSLATAPDWSGRLRAIKARGGKVVVVDPCRTKTARMADEHIFIRPGTDAFLLMAMVHTLFEKGLVRPDRLADFTNGIEEVEAVSREFSPEAVEARCGVPAADIRRLTLELANSPTAAVYGRMGASTVAFGSLTNWLVDVLNLLTGNLDRPGGAMFPSPAHLPAAGKPGGKGWGMGRWASRVKGRPEIMGEFPAFTLCDEIETQGTGQIRALITVASNPVMGLPNAARVDQALAALDFMVAVDFYVNASTRHAHVILPPTGPLSTAHYDVYFHNMAVRDTARYSPPVLPKPDDEMDKWEILYRLALIFGGQGAQTDAAVLDDFIAEMTAAGAAAKEGAPLFGKQKEIVEALKAYRGPERILEFMLRTGTYGDRFGGNLEGLSLAALIVHTHGLDLGPLKQRLPDLLKTTSAKIELAPQLLLEDAARLSRALTEDAPKGLLLIGRRHLRTNNSWMSNLKTLTAGPPRCTLQVHPQDAKTLGLSEGGAAEVISRIGRLTVPVELTVDIMPGVVSLPHGWGQDQIGVGMSNAREAGGANSNILSDDKEIDPLSGNAVLNGIPVEVRPV